MMEWLAVALVTIVGVLLCVWAGRQLCDRSHKEHSLLPPYRITPPPEYEDMSHEERLDWLEANVTKPWCVVEDLSPFLLLIKSQHETQKGAQRASSWSSYLRVMETERAHRLNRKMTEDEEFFEALLRRKK